LGTDEQKRSISYSLDPAQYAAHVERTSLLLEQLAENVRGLREQHGRLDAELARLREDIMRQGAYVLERDFRRDYGLQGQVISDLKAEVASNKETIARLAGTLGWLTKLVVGAVLTGLISGGIAIIFRFG